MPLQLLDTSRVKALFALGNFILLKSIVRAKLDPSACPVNIIIAASAIFALYPSELIIADYEKLSRLRLEFLPTLKHFLLAVERSRVAMSQHQHIRADSPFWTYLLVAAVRPKFPDCAAKWTELPFITLFKKLKAVAESRDNNPFRPKVVNNRKPNHLRSRYTEKDVGSKGRRKPAVNIAGQKGTRLSS